jgi:glycerophosphoryl diester phosphodiesterase
MKIIGHRGARGLAPENTVLALSHALDHHVDEVEFDVRVTKDSIAVLHHDPAITINGSTLRIAHYTYEELRKHKHDLTSLESALDFINAKCRPHIEIKPGEPIEPIIRVVQKFLDSKIYTIRDFLFASKSQAILRTIHKAFPGAEMVVIESWSGIRARRRARELGTTRLSMKATWLWSGFLKPMAKRGYQITPYTLNNPAKARRWSRYIYGVITDYPNLFRG